MSEANPFKKLKSWKGESKKDWATETPINDPLPTDKITAGALMRIADSLEIIAKSNTSLESELQRYKRYYEAKCTRVKQLELSNAALRGVITRMKRKKSK